jgi:hypothetical protein
MNNESVKVWKKNGVVVLSQTLIEDGLDLSTSVEIGAETAPWLRDTLALFAGNWQTPDQQHGQPDEKIEIFSAGNEMDPRVGIQNERGGQSFSMIVRLPLVRKLVQLLSGAIPAEAPRSTSPEQQAAKATPAPESDKQPQIVITTTECRDPLGDPAETVEISCGEACYWDWDAEDLLKQLTRLQQRLAAQKSDNGKAEILLHDDSYLLPGTSALDKEQNLARMITQLEKRFGQKRKK